MAKSTTPPPTASPPTDKPKRARNRKLQYYLATIRGNSLPTLIIAKSQKEALAAVLTLKAATPGDLLSAGRLEYDVINTSVVAVEILEAAKAA